MTDNEKIARWHNPSAAFAFDMQLSNGCIPSFAWIHDYFNDDAAAMSLLDTMVEKGYMVSLENDSKGWITCYVPVNKTLASFIYDDVDYQPTRREAVVAAVLQLVTDKP